MKAYKNKIGARDDYRSGSVLKARPGPKTSGSDPDPSTGRASVEDYLRLPPHLKKP